MAEAQATKSGRQEETRHLDMATQPVKRLRTMLAAGEDVLEIQRVLGRTGDSVVSELLRGHETFYEWDHYPKGTSTTATATPSTSTTPTPVASGTRSTGTSTPSCAPRACRAA